jgi:hypothetical protein
MKPMSFLRSVGIAFAIALAVSVLFSVLTAVGSSFAALRSLIPAAAFAYLLCLMARSPLRSGKVTAILAWAAAATGLWFFVPGIALYLLLHGLLIWAIRSLCWYRSLFSAVLDLGVTLMSLAAAVWAGQHTGGLFLSVWSLFLVQTLFVFIPTSAPKRQPKTIAADPEDAFARAERAAQTALRRLAANS